MTKNKSYFITIEGIEGVGKSSALQTVSRFLDHQKIPYITTREPGGTDIAEAIRQLLLSTFSEPMHPDTELLLMFASRAQHIETVIKPALTEGKWVVCDRFTDASFAYQGGGRGIEMQRIARLADWVHADLQPDVTLLLDAPVEVALGRIQHREKDRIEQEQNSFFQKVRAAYLDLASQHPERYRRVDASQSMACVQEQLELILKQLVY